jgi:hypothetical protein
MSRQVSRREGQTLVVTSNGRVRELLSYHDLTLFEQADIGYLIDDDFEGRFVRAYKTVIDVNEVPLCIGILHDFGWQGSESWSAWDGIVVKMVDDDNGPGAVVGRYVITGM